MTRHYEDGLEYKVRTLDDKVIILDKYNELDVEIIDSLRRRDQIRNETPKNKPKIKLLALAAMPGISVS